MKKTLTTFTAFLLLLVAIPHKKETCAEILEKMFKSIRGLKTAGYDLVILERVNGKLLEAGSRVKLQMKPKKIYLKNRKEVEILWADGTNKGMAYVHPNTFPFVTLNLDPLGPIMRKEQHHTIHELGFEFIGRTVANFVLKESDFLQRHFSFIGTTNWEGKVCYQLYFTYQEYAYESYVVQKGETVRSIAKKLNIGEYKILEKNPRLTDFGSVKEGSKLQVPNCYASRILLLVDKSNLLPVNIKIYDDLGLYESYEYRNLRVNCTFAADEFSKGYKEYKF